MTNDDGQFIAPPPGIAPTPREPVETRPAPEPVAPEDLITLPPGIVDSGTYRVARERTAGQEGSAGPVHDDAPPAFFPTAAPGMPPAPPVTPLPDAPSPIAAPVTETVAQPADEVTRASVRPGEGAWLLRLPDGAHVSLQQTTLVGRDPAHSARWPQAALLPVDDAAKTVSKTHAALELTATGQLLVHDLDSTNGVYLAYPGGDEFVVDAGEGTLVEHGASLGLGEFTVVVERA